MFDTRRREFIALLGGLAAAWPLALRAQQAERMRRIGVLLTLNADDKEGRARLSAFVEGLKELGWIDGRNIQIDTRFGPAAATIRKQAAELVALAPEVILANGSAAAGPLLQVTHTVPIVFVIVPDPVGAGFVASLARPGGNATGFLSFEYSIGAKWLELLKEIITGILFFSGSLGAKRLDLLRQLLPRATAIAMLASSITPESEAERDAVQAAAQAIGQQLIVREVRSVSDLDVAFAAFVQRAAGAMLAGAGPFIFSNSERIVTLAARYAIPAMYATREPVTLGGLMSYASSLPDAYHQAGIYVGRILKGERPGELPVMRSTKFEFVLNLKTARTLGLDIPPTLLALADEVIE